MLKDLGHACLCKKRQFACPRTDLISSEIQCDVLPTKEIKSSESSSDKKKTTPRPQLQPY
jgi:hypothetical protein